MAGGPYDTVFLDVDGTLLWVDLDVEGYVRDLAPYAPEGVLTVEKARAPVWEGLRAHIAENINYPTRKELASFKRANAERTARSLGLHAPPAVLEGVAARRISFNPYPESEAVLGELKSLGLRLFVVSNWDVELVAVLEDLDWHRFFDGVVASAAVGVEKPEGRIFEEALQLSGRAGERGRVVHVGNDPVSDVRGAAHSGIDAVFVDRRGEGEHPQAVASIPDLRPLPGLLGDRQRSRGRS